MSKILVVYYSRTGMTKKVAEKIKEKLNLASPAGGCDVEEIISEKNRSGVIGYVICGREATLKILGEIKPIVINPLDYDLVVIGTPVWAWNISSPIRSYLENNKDKFKKIAGFCTMGGDGNKQVFAEIEKICGKKLVAQLALKTKEVLSDNFSEKLESFIKVVK